MTQKETKRAARGAGRWKVYATAGLLLVAVVVAAVAWSALRTSPQDEESGKPIILYVDQGNGVVNTTNFGTMADFAVAHGFNTIFFQVYREGVLLFDQQSLAAFVSDAHALNLSIFFSLYITNSSQEIPLTALGSGENGVSLDMSTLSLSSQESLLALLKSEYGGQTAVTTTDMTSPLTPNLLVLETYGTGLQSYVRHGVIGSVGVFTTSSLAQYQSEFDYALKNSDGVMVFDYAGLMKSGYY